MHDAQAVEVFQSFARFTIGDVRRVFFWRDRWIDGRTAEEIAAVVVALVSTRRKNNHMVSEAINENVWIADIAGQLSVESCVQ
jgi:hypothetical protein